MVVRFGSAAKLTVTVSAKLGSTSLGTAVTTLTVN
jgi:hypothetical protein